MAKEKRVARRKIEAADAMKKYMADYYLELDQASRTGERKIAWASSVGPAEILRAMGFLVYFPETHSAMLGATRMAVDMIPHANALGYSPEICSYLTADVGAYVRGITPLTRAYGIQTVPKPDVLVFNTNQCRDVQDWFAWYAREFDAPLVGVRTHRGVREVTESLITSVARQMEGLIEPLAEVSGHAFDLDELRDVVALSRDCSELWKAVLETAAAVPSPLTFFDGTTLMGPAVVGRGTQEAVDFYRILLAELEKRVDDGVGAVEGERFRLYWEGMPIWGRLRAHSELFAGLEACVLASTYCNSWIFSAFDAAEPFRSMARAYTELFIVRSDEAKERYIKQMLDTFQIDGVIYHDARTCPNNSNNRYGMPRRLEEETGIPSLTVNGDLNDLRCLSDEQFNTNVEAFVEQLEERR
ncbi:MAG: 2-hydroxyacyl-CoA dehydratase family protein [Anaerolineae bacterium]|jgi:benzoyl-CoA reductase/2-hydroxyglutaryl-CoA dehydratase subunit BcrC/BadD/HgdB